MRVVVISPNPVELAELSSDIKTLHPDSEIAAFGDPMLAVKYGVNNQVDALYTAVDMKRLSGFEVAKLLREDNAKLLVNFIAADADYRQDALRLGMNSYTVRPATVEALKAAEEETW